MSSTSLTTIPANAKVPAIIQQHFDEEADDLTSGVSGGFAVVSIRGSKWRIKHQGEEYPVLDAEGNPLSTLEVVLVKANKAISKNYYERGFEEGAAEAPDCFSLDGIAPDTAVQSPVSTTCAKCPKNVFGSRMTPAGKKAKACSDNRRMAVVPLGDLENSTYGGPMLLRVPAASLADLKVFGETMKRRGFAYNGVAVRLGFDLDTAYPKVTFKAMRVLTDAEAAIVAEHLNGDVVARILATAGEIAPIDADDTAIAGAAPADPDFEQPPVAPPAAKVAAAPKAVAAARPGPAPAPAAKPAATAAVRPGPRPVPTPAKPAAVKPAPAPAPAPEPEVIEGEVVAADEDVQVAEGSNALDAEIEGILGDLDSLS
jgi:hypothetical protein